MNDMEKIEEKTALISAAGIENRIYTVRGVQVMIDRDLASLYEVETRTLKQAVRRNLEKFPEDFMFRLTKKESNYLISSGVSQSVIPSGYNTGGAETFAFTEQGVAMLATVLKSRNASEMSIAIMRAFVAMRRFLVANADVFKRLDSLDRRQLETEHKLDAVLNRLEDGTMKPKCGIFFDGQTFDAYVLVSGLIKSAKNRIALIDNYVDESVLTMLDKRKSGVEATIYTLQLSKQFKLDLEKHNSQYPPITVKILKDSHDRFLIIDDIVYHVGASLKDLGKKWFAIMKMEDKDGKEILGRL